MRVVAPAYYRSFACIASACRHNCCIGWEVDVDEGSLERYSNMKHPYAENIRSSIEGESPHFLLSAQERCPHLDVSGLCRIITECGEESLCQICRDHPRYRNYYDGAVEIGLGLSCEEAARLALDSEVGFIVSDSEDMSRTEYFSEYPAELFSEEESGILAEKKRLISLICDRSLPVERRIDILLPKRPCVDEIKALFLSLDTLDNEWKSRIKTLSANDFVLDLEKYSVLIERTLCAFVYRHVCCESFYEPSSVGAFAALSALVIAALSSTPEDFYDVVRAYSAEVEYSVENTEKMLDFLEEFI